MSEENLRKIVILQTENNSPENNLSKLFYMPMKKNKIMIILENIQPCYLQFS